MQHHISYLENLASQHGGELISKEWLGWKSKYEFNFVKGDNTTRFHRALKSMMDTKYAWPKSLAGMQQKTESKEIKFKKLQQKAIEMGGSLVSKQWLGCSVRHDFEMNGVPFQLTPKEVTRGQWIQDRGLVTEPICRQVLEHLFGYKFNKTKQVLTADKTGSKKALELDGYCQELNIAFEYQGHPSHWDSSHSTYEETVKTDTIKKETCQKLGVTLIVIEKIKEKKYDSDIFFSRVLALVNDAFSGKELPALNTAGFKIDFSTIHHSQEQMKKMQDVAVQNGCTLLTKEWSGASSVYEFQENKTGRILKLTSLHINKSERGFPKNIDLHFKLMASRQKH